MGKNNLSDQMQARLEAWKTRDKEAQEKVFSYVSKGDYLDSIEDIEDREAKRWKEHLAQHPEFRRR